MTGRTQSSRARKILSFFVLTSIGLLIVTVGAVTLQSNPAPQPVIVIPSPEESHSEIAEPLIPGPVVTESPVTIDDDYYSSCADARRAGVAPIRRGNPGYRLELDRNRDGIACE